MRSIGLLSSISRALASGEQPVPPTAFAIDGERLTGASFRREGAVLRLVERHAVPLPAAALGQGALGGPVGDAEALAGAVAELVARFARRPRRASLVLPDAWARGVVVELGSLPERSEPRAEVLRFRLRKLVPFRTEELRVAASPIAPVAGQEDPLRALVLYASEGLCSSLEKSFAAAGVEIGQIVGTSVALLGALARRHRVAGLVALATVESRGFTLLCARDGEPVVWRQKSFDGGAGAESRAPSLAAELKLTRTFLAERLGMPDLDAVVLKTGDGARSSWADVLAEGLGREPVELTVDWLPLAAESASMDGLALAPLVGAVSREVA